MPGLTTIFNWWKWIPDLFCDSHIVPQTFPLLIHLINKPTFCNSIHCLVLVPLEATDDALWLLSLHCSDANALFIPAVVLNALAFSHFCSHTAWLVIRKSWSASEMLMTHTGESVVFPKLGYSNELSLSSHTTVQSTSACVHLVFCPPFPNPSQHLLLLPLLFRVSNLFSCYWLMLLMHASERPHFALLTLSLFFCSCPLFMIHFGSTGSCHL